MPAPSQTFNQVFSCKGPLVLPVDVDFTLADSQEIDLTPFIQQAQIDFISSVYIDMDGITVDVTLSTNLVKQAIHAKAGTVGYYPIMVGNAPKFVATVSAPYAGVIKFIFSNIPFLPTVQYPSGQQVDIIAVGGTPVTSPLPVDIGAVGTLDINLAEVGGVAVTDPLPVDTGEVFQGAYTDRSIANLSGASEQLMAANANRRILIVQNVGATDIAINLTGGAAAINTAGSITIGSGGSITIDNYPPTSAINIIGTLNADVTAYEG